MIDDFEFTIYNKLPKFTKNNITWYLTPLYDFEFDYIKSTFKEHDDYIVFKNWGMNNGCDVLISSKIYIWLCLNNGEPNADSGYEDEFSIHDIKSKLYSV